MKSPMLPYNIDNLRRSPRKKSVKAVEGRRKLDFTKDWKTKKPLFGWKVFLDINSSTKSKEIKNRILSLGGTVEDFLSKDIKLVITSRKEIQKTEALTNAISPLSAGFTPSPLLSTKRSVTQGLSSYSGDSPQHSVERGKRSKIVNITRGKSLLDKVLVTGRGAGNASAVSKAVQFGAVIVSVDEFTRKYMKTRNNEPEVDLSSLKTDKRSRQMLKSSRTRQMSRIQAYQLEKPFFKIEDKTRHFRPVVCETKFWPKLYFQRCQVQSPFELIKEVHSERGKTCGAEVDEETLSMSEASDDVEDEEEIECREETPGDQNKISATTKLVDARQATKPGYCDCCSVRYQDLAKHLNSDHHRAFATNEENFKELDALIKDATTFDSFLGTLSKKVRRKNLKEKNETEKCFSGFLSSGKNSFCNPTRCDSPHHEVVTDSGRFSVTYAEDEVVVNHDNLNRFLNVQASNQSAVELAGSIISEAENDKDTRLVNSATCSVQLEVGVKSSPKTPTKGTLVISKICITPTNNTCQQNWKENLLPSPISLSNNRKKKTSLTFPNAICQTSTIRNTKNTKEVDSVLPQNNHRSVSNALATHPSASTPVSKNENIDQKFIEDEGRRDKRSDDKDKPLGDRNNESTYVCRRRLRQMKTMSSSQTTELVGSHRQVNCEENVLNVDNNTAETDNIKGSLAHNITYHAHASSLSKDKQYEVTAIDSPQKESQSSTYFSSKLPTKLENNISPTVICRKNRRQNRCRRKFSKSQVSSQVFSDAEKDSTVEETEREFREIILTDMQHPTSPQSQSKEYIHTTHSSLNEVSDCLITPRRKVNNCNIEKSDNADTETNVLATDSPVSSKNTCDYVIPSLRHCTFEPSHSVEIFEEDREISFNKDTNPDLENYKWLQNLPFADRLKTLVEETGDGSNVTSHVNNFDETEPALPLCSESFETHKGLIEFLKSQNSVTTNTSCENVHPGELTKISCTSARTYGARSLGDVSELFTEEDDEARRCFKGFLENGDALYCDPQTCSAEKHKSLNLTENYETNSFTHGIIENTSLSRVSERQSDFSDSMLLQPSELVAVDNSFVAVMNGSTPTKARTHIKLHNQWRGRSIEGCLTSRTSLKSNILKLDDSVFEEDQLFESTMKKKFSVDVLEYTLKMKNVKDHKTDNAVKQQCNQTESTSLPVKKRSVTPLESERKRSRTDSDVLPMQTTEDGKKYSAVTPTKQRRLSEKQCTSDISEIINSPCTPILYDRIKERHRKRVEETDSLKQSENQHNKQVGLTYFTTAIEGSEDSLKVAIPLEVLNCSNERKHSTALKQKRFSSCDIYGETCSEKKQKQSAAAGNALRVSINLTSIRVAVKKGTRQIFAENSNKRRCSPRKSSKSPLRESNACVIVRKSPRKQLKPTDLDDNFTGNKQLAKYRSHRKVVTPFIKPKSSKDLSIPESLRTSFEFEDNSVIDQLDSTLKRKKKAERTSNRHASYITDQWNSPNDRQFEANKFCKSRKGKIISCAKYFSR